MPEHYVGIYIVWKEHSIEDPELQLSLHWVLSYKKENSLPVLSHSRPERQWRKQTSKKEMENEGNRENNILTTALNSVDFPTLGSPTIPALRLMLILEPDDEYDLFPHCQRKARCGEKEEDCSGILLWINPIASGTGLRSWLVVVR